MPDSLNDIGNEAPAYGGDGIVDNCIVQSQVVAGNADFFSVAGLNLTLIANATDPFGVSVAGKRVKLTANVIFAVMNNAHNFVWIDQTGALGVTTLPCVYSFTAPAGATGQHWFDLGKNTMKVWNGAAFVATSRVFIGYVRADAGTIDARYVCQPIGAYPFWISGTFGDGSDGFLDVSAGTTTINGLKQYSAVVVRGGTLNTTSSTTSELNILSQNFIAVIGSGAVTMPAAVGGGAGATTTGSTGGTGGRGGRGGGGGGGTSGGGVGGPGVDLLGRLLSTANGGTGGATLGGGGGLGVASPYVGENLYPIFGMWGSGGGGGGGDGAVAGGNGGASSVGAYFLTQVVALGASASMTANGANGVAGSAANRGGGGGGGGGMLLYRCRGYFINGTQTASGGTGGGSGGAGSGAGGNGGAGLVKRWAI